jgi:CheY-like chemotaxis protein
MATGRLNIVIADDDRDDIELFQAALSEVACDANLTVAYDGEELSALLGELPIPDAIVLDLNMPKKGGLQCLKELRTNVDFEEVPIVILSTSSSPLSRNNCLLNGANLYLTKPNTFEGMKAIAQQICNRK